MNQAMSQYLYSMNGQYLGVVSGSPEQILSQIPEGGGIAMFPPPRGTDYWDGTNWVNIGPKPFYYMEFDYETKKWKDTRDLNETRQLKWNQIKLERNQLEFGGFEFEGNKYDSDSSSQLRIISAHLFGLPTLWTLKTDEVIELDGEQIEGLGKALAKHVQSAHERGRKARELILSAESCEQVDAVLF